MEKLGICPICEKGQILNGTQGYVCNYFVSIENQCHFRIYKEMFNVEITSDIALEILRNGNTEEVFNCETKAGKKFRASFILDKENKVVKPLFEKIEEVILEKKCPKCDEFITDGSKGWRCKNYSDGCDFYLPKQFLGVLLSIDDLNILLTGNKTRLMTFEGAKGEFTARIEMGSEGKILFDSSICKCPKCKTGNIYASTKSYNCSNYKETGCDFSIWREIAHKSISIEHIIILCNKGTTEIIKGFSFKDKKADRKLTLSDDFKVKLI